MTFPLVFNTEEDYIKHIKDNRDYYLNILFSGKEIKEENFDNKLEEITKQLQQENENKLLEELNKKDLFYQERIKNMEELVSLIQLKNLLNFHKASNKMQILILNHLDTLNGRT